jgi:hypothetical protein
MRLARIGDTGGERPAVWDRTTWRDLTALTDHPYLRQGDVVEPEIDGLGRQRQNLAEV